MKRKLSISRAWDETRPIVARDGALLASVAAALIVLPQALIAVTVSEDTEPGWKQVAALVAMMIAFWAQLALIRLALQPPTTVGAAIGHGARRFVPFVGAFLLFVVGVVLLLLPVAFVAVLLGVQAPVAGQQPGGAALLLVLVMVVVIIALSVRFAIAAPVAAAEEAGPIAIIRRSWALSKGHFWRLLAFALLVFVLAAVLTLAATSIGSIIGRLISPDLEPFSVGTLVVGLLVGIAQAVVAIIASVMIARIYVQLADGSEAAVSVPISGT